MKLVVVTPAGRRRYLEVLAQYVLPVVDRWDLWVNTLDGADLQWMRELASRFPKVRLVEVPDEYPQFHNFRIHKFFPHATDSDTVYIRLDDDIVYVEKGALERIKEYRISNPAPFLVYGNVLNSGLTSHLHQRAGRLSKSWGVAKYDCMCEVGWKNPEFVTDLHRKFLADPDPKKWHLQNWDLFHYERHSINCISWLGSDCANWVPRMDADEEVWLSVAAPTQFSRPNVALGDATVIHYSFHPTRNYLDSQPWILGGYKTLAGV